MTTWKPGDVTKVAGMPAMFTGSQRRSGRWAFADGSSAPEDHVPAPRPLVVIDPGSAEDTSRLWRLLPDDLVSIDQLEAALREFAAPTPPKPAEPTGLYARVEEADGRVWVRTALQASVWRAEAVNSNGFRYLIPEDGAFAYESLAVVRVLSEGIQ